MRQGNELEGLCCGIRGRDGSRGSSRFVGEFVGILYPMGGGVIPVMSVRMPPTQTNGGGTPGGIYTA